jgi:hypothetical protein
MLGISNGGGLGGKLLGWVGGNSLLIAKDQILSTPPLFLTQVTKHVKLSTKYFLSSLSCIVHSPFEHSSSIQLPVLCKIESELTAEILPVNTIT